MTLTQLRERTAKLVDYDGDTTEGSDPVGSTLDIAINWGQDVLSKKLYLYSGSVTFTLSASSITYDGQDTSVFGKRMLQIDRVVIGGSILRGPTGEYGTYTAEELDAWHSSWRTVTNGTPESASFAHPTLTVTPPASAAISNSFVQGRHLADALSANGDVSDLPEEVHELICYLAAYYIQSPVVDTDEGWTRMKVYRQDADHLIADLYVEQYSRAHGRRPVLIPGGSGGDN